MMNHDRFRMVYQELQPNEIELIAQVKGMAAELCIKLHHIQNREMSIAMTNLEQGMMWAIKAICIQSEEIKERGDQL
jgi:hypothetical protein